MISNQWQWLVAATAVTAVLGDDSNNNKPQLVEDDSACGCFLTNATVPTFYAHRQFFDFRNLTQYAGVPDVKQNETKDTAGDVSSPYFQTDEWTKNWGIQTWDNSKGEGQGLSNDASVYMINSANNIYIESNKDDEADSNTYLTMRTKRLPHMQTAAEFENTAYNFHYMSMRMYARTLGSAGAVAAMFTYRNSDDPAKVQEADIEILTHDPKDKIQYTNQPSDLPDEGEITEATRNATIPGGLKWSDWAVHRVDWAPERSVWFVNGQEAANIAFQVPRDASGINFNMWSDGGSWSGNMTVGGEALLQIKWIEYVYNTTDKDVLDGGRQRRSLSEGSSWTGARGGLVARKDKQKSCGAVCSIDDTPSMGSVALLWNNTDASTSAGNHGRGTASMALYAWATIVGLPLSLWMM